MIVRADHEAPPRRRPTPAKRVLPLIALVIAALLVARWASTTVAGPLASAFRDPAALALATAAAQEPPAPQQPTRPQPTTPLDSLDRRFADPAAPLVTEAMIHERELRAAATAFPVSRTLELSSTMYCLKGEMRTGIRTRDGMAAGDPRVLPLGSVVRVSRPDGTFIGIFVIMDTGGAIRGNDIDLYVDSCHEAERWGRHPVVAEVLAIGKRI